MPKKTPLPLSEVDYLAAEAAKAKARYRKRTRTPRPTKGRPSEARDTLLMIHVAAQRMWGLLTQGRMMKEAAALFNELHEIYPDCVAPTHNTLRKYVKVYILYRRGHSARSPLPHYVRHALNTLPPGIQVDALLGFAGNVVSHDPKKLAPTIRGKRALSAADLTRRLLLISSLSSPST